ncbi:MAG: amidohydrolase family protein [Cyclobacteriaceae bacterium]|nr:amidohydrolase family protein [Cyclobacteriaceae bacterium]
MIIKHWKLLLLLIAALPAPGIAQDERELPPVTRTYAITHTTVVQAPGRKIEGATVILKDGIITQVGKDIPVPADAKVIKGDSLFVYAGFIDGLSHTGVIKPKEENNRERPKDPGNPGYEKAGITPQQDVRNLLNPADKSIEEWRALGFTVAQVVPHGVFLPGNASIIQLGGGAPDQSVLVSNSALYSELVPTSNVYPSTLIGVLSKWRELYKQATLSHNYEQVYASNRSGLERPVTDRVLQAFYPVIDKKQPVLFRADQPLDIYRVFNLQSELQFPVIAGDLKDGSLALQRIKASGIKIFLSLDLPEAPKDEGKKDDKNTPDAEKQQLEKRKKEALDRRVGQAAAFVNAGISFGFSGLSAKPKDVMANLRRMIAAGLSTDQALAALTTVPAQLLGLSDRMGTVEPGKMANLVVTAKPLFDEKSKVRYVWVDGTMFQYQATEVKKKDDGTKADIQGVWSFSIDTPQGKTENKVTFKKDGDSYTGNVVGGMITEPVDLTDIDLDGNALKFNFKITIDGNTVNVSIDGKVDGTSFNGTTSAGSFGSFATTASKDPKF